MSDLVEALHMELNEAGEQSPISKTVETNDRKLVDEKYQEWLKSYFMKQCNSPVAKLFYGHLIDVSVCNNCEYIRYGFDYFATLPLDLTRKRMREDAYSQYPLSNSWTASKESFTMRSLIDDFFREEKIPDFKCEGCKKAGHMSKRQHLKLPPRCLLLFLKRFEQNGKDVIKLEEKVRLDEIVEIKSTVKNSLSFLYKPVSFVEHFGTLSAGHYTCKGLQNDGRWVAFSDDRTVVANIEPLRKPGSTSIYLCALSIQK